MQINALLHEHPASGIYSATSFDATTETLQDLSGNGLHARVTEGTASVRAESGHGALTIVKALAGDISSRVLWPPESIPVTFTVCSVTRYDFVDSDSGRILNCKGSPAETSTGSPSSVNWLHGHWSGRRGVAYYGDHFTTPTDGLDYPTEWLVMCGTNDESDAPQKRIVIDQVGSTSEPALSPNIVAPGMSALFDA